MQKFCGYCGSPLKEGQKFCQGCGHPVPQSTQPAQPVQPKQPTQPVQNDPQPNPQPVTTKKNKGCGKSLLLIAVIVLVIVGAMKLFDKPDKPQQDQNTSSTKSPKSTQSGSSTTTFIEDLPPVVLDGKGYQLELPGNANDVECAPVSDERLAQLKKQGYNIVGTPLSVTRNGDRHVQLDGAAMVSIDIPKDYPKEKYNELVGVLITDEGPQYKIPDYYALREGVVRFETTHFSEATAEQNKEKLRERFIDEIAVNGWRRNMDNKTLEPTWREQLTKYANDHCLGENDLAGIAARELFADNDIVKVGMDIVNAHDMENASLEERMKVASENMVKIAETKMLAYFLNKLKEEDTKKLKVIDELKSEKKGEIVFKTELEKINSRRNKIIAVLEDRFSIDNVEKLSAKLGEGADLNKCWALACDQVKDYAKGQLESKAKELLPYVKVVQATAKGVEIWKKFWASTQMNDLYQKFENRAEERGGLVDDDDWREISYRMATPKFLHDMSHEEIRAMLEERYREKKEIERRKNEARQLLDIIETYVNLNSECLEKKHFDYVQRLTIVNNLMDRFRNELLDRDGNLVYYDDGYRRILGIPKLINEQLCFVINEYFECYPDQEKFYKWLGDNGYNYGRLQADYDKLDALLWTEKPQYDPEMHIVIQEILGAESGHAVYVGHTICLGAKEKPYKGWFCNIPDEDVYRDEGWSVEFPFEDDPPCLLSQYKAMGMPNQVLVYEKEDDFRQGKKPLEAIDFVVDTTGGTTVVDLNALSVDAYWYITAIRCMGFENEINYHNPNAHLDGTDIKPLRCQLSIEGNQFHFEMPDMQMRQKDGYYEACYNITGFTLEGRFEPVEGRENYRDKRGSIRAKSLKLSPSTLKFKRDWKDGVKVEVCTMTLSEPETEEKLLPMDNASFNWYFTDLQCDKLESAHIRFPVKVSRRFSSKSYKSPDYDGEGVVYVSCRYVEAKKK
jgi:hypothetical protein